MIFLNKIYKLCVAAIVSLFLVLALIPFSIFIGIMVILALISMSIIRGKEKFERML